MVIANLIYLVFTIGNDNAFSMAYSPDSGNESQYYWLGLNDNQNIVEVLPQETSGIGGISEWQGYFNGSPAGDPITSDPLSSIGSGVNIYLGAGCIQDNYYLISPWRFIQADIQAVVIYDQTLSDSEVAAISSAMADLTGGYPTDTPTITLTFTPSNTPTITKTFTPTSSFTPTETFTLTPSYTPSETATATSSLTPTSSPVPTDTRTPTITRTPIPAAVLTGTYETAYTYYSDIAANNYPNVLISSILCLVILLGLITWLVIASVRRKR